MKYKNISLTVLEYGFIYIPQYDLLIWPNLPTSKYVNDFILIPISGKSLQESELFLERKTF